MVPQKLNFSIFRLVLGAFFLLSAFVSVSHTHQQEILSELALHAQTAEGSHSCPACAFRTLLSSGLISKPELTDIQLFITDAEQIAVAAVYGLGAESLLPSTRAPPSVI